MIEDHIVNNVDYAVAEAAANARQPIDAIVGEYRKWCWVAPSLALRIAVIGEWHWRNVKAKNPKPAEVLLVEPSRVEIEKEIIKQQKKATHWLFLRAKVGLPFFCAGAGLVATKRWHGRGLARPPRSASDAVSFRTRRLTSRMSR